MRLQATGLAAVTDQGEVLARLGEDRQQPALVDELFDFRIHMLLPIELLALSALEGFLHF